MTNNFVLLTQATDTGIGGSPIFNQGFAGIRTDFMDVYFENYKLVNI